MSFEGRINIQGSRASFIERMATDVKLAEFQRMELTSLQSQLDMLETYWSKFEEMHEKLVLGKDIAILEHEYVKRGVYDTCLEHYSTTRSTLVQLIKTKDDSADLFSDSFRRMSQAAATSHSRMLPKISLPKFSGSYSEWRSFKDLFSSMVIANRDVSIVEKMHYLRTSLSGEPAKLIANMPVAEDSFTPAWNLLISRYDNERLLITAQLEKLLNPSKITVRSSKELNTLINSTTEALNALQALGSPVDRWDQVLVYILSQRLDPKTREAWENDIGASTCFPTYKNLEEFVTGRARALESLEMNSPVSTTLKTRNNTKSTSPSRSAAHGTSSKKVHAATTSARSSQSSAGSSTDTNSYSCSMCSNEHFIVRCSQFRQLTPEKRRELVISKHLCFNCLGKHSVRTCQSSKRCQLCNEKHHSMIHLNTTSPSDNTIKTVSSQPAQAATLTAQHTEKQK